MLSLLNSCRHHSEPQLTPAINFTLDQKKAHDHLRHLSITASAGSGKTRVLVSRFCDLVEYVGAPIESVAAITFTEKAAAELRTKIAAELRSRLNDVAHAEHRERIEKALDDFHRSVVSTIHGFCAELLREFPLESGVSPDFTIVSGFERRVLESEALNQAIERAFDTSIVADAGYRANYEILRRIGREYTVQFVRMMTSKREAIALARMDGFLNVSRSDTLELWEANLLDAVKDLLHESVFAEIESLIAHLKPPKAGVAQPLFDSLRSADSLQGINEMAKPLMDVLLTLKGEPRLGNYVLPKEELLPVTKSSAEIVFEALKSVEVLTAGDASVNPTLLDDAMRILAIADDAQALYSARKIELNVLDFEDLQLQTLSMLHEDSIPSRLRDRFQFLMIDEFQDTNQLQYTLAYRVLDNLKAGNLCVVGDVKQSIYGFRNADVEVFARADRDIVRLNQTRINSENGLMFRGESIATQSNDELAGVVHLSASFRLLPNICAYVNAVCRDIVTQSRQQPNGVPYHDLMSGRTSEGTGRIEFILASKQDSHAQAADVDADTEGGNADEMQLIAKRIANMVRSGGQLVYERSDEGEEHARAVRYRDVAILCRRRAQFADLERAFRALDIPFVTNAGSGFFATQEVCDITNYLRVLIDEHDDLALLGVLRSPFFGISDAELYRLSVNNSPNNAQQSFWKQTCAWAERPESADPLKRAVTLLDEQRKLAGRIPLPLLLRHILDNTGWRGAIAGAQRSEQAIANIEKVLAMARELEQSGLLTLFDFVNQLSSQIDEEDAESEAPVADHGDAVLIMTMHAAKGLEYPVVILPSLQSRPRASIQPFFDRDLGFGWQWEYQRVKNIPAIVPLMQLRQRNKDRAEEARLFYVATTRARDVLIISGTLTNEKPPKGTMLQWALAPFDAIPLTNDRITLTSPALTFLNADGISTRTVEWTQTIHFHREIDLLPIADPDNRIAQYSFPIERVHLQSVVADRDGRVITDGAINLFRASPDKYHQRYVLGLPEIIDYRDTVGSSVDGGEWMGNWQSSNYVIELLKDVIARISTRSQLSGPELATVVNEAVLRSKVPSVLRDGTAAHLVTVISQLAADPSIVRAVFPDNAEVHTQQTLTMPIGNDYVQCRYERVIRESDGSISALVFDDAQSNSTAKAQMELAACVLLKKYQSCNSVRITSVSVGESISSSTEEFERGEMDGVWQEAMDSVREINAMA